MFNLGCIFVPVGRRSLRAGAAAVLMLGSVGSAQAAIVQVVSGEILVNEGAGYKQAPSDRPVKAGDQVMVKGDGKARIIYSNGCFVEVPRGVVRVVLTEDQCQVGNSVSNTTTSGFAGPTTSQILIGGAVVGGAVVGVLLATKDKSTSP